MIWLAKSKFLSVKLKIIKNSFCSILCALFILILFQGCLSSSGSSSFNTSTSNNSSSKDLSEADKEINRTKQQIQDYEEYRIRELHNAVINDMENTKSLGWVKLDGHPTYEEIATRSYANVAATEKEISRLKNRLKHLENEKQVIQNQSSGCFLPETLVKMEDGSLKSLAKLQPGEKVLTYDIGYDKQVIKQVIKTYSVKANHLYTINNQLTATGGERLLSQNGWEKIRNLKIGDIVHLDNHMVKIENIDYVRSNQILYNIQVDDTHNFYVVTADGSNYLVHNSGGGGGGGGSK